MEAVQIVFNLVMTVLIIFVPYKRDMLLVRILVQAVSGLVFIVVTLYITFKGPRAEQVHDINVAKSELGES